MSFNSFYMQRSYISTNSVEDRKVLAYLLFFYSGILVKGNLYGGYVYFSSQRRVWTDSTHSLLKADWCKANKAQSSKAVLSDHNLVPSKNSLKGLANSIPTKFASSKTNILFLSV